MGNLLSDGTGGGTKGGARSVRFDEQYKARQDVLDLNFC